MTDPITGKAYNINSELPDDPEITDRLTHFVEDADSDIIGKRWEIWNDFQIKVEESYHDNVLKFNTGLFSVQEVTSMICEVVQKPVV